MFCSVLSFFYLSGHHRDLHSFPTRRSSDLPAHGAGVGFDLREQRGSAGRANSSVPAAVIWGYRRIVGDADRSEEHTSELQSLTNLVCRLLLEKKKKQRPG